LREKAAQAEVSPKHCFLAELKPRPDEKLNAVLVLALFARDRGLSS
jgi:hypothetical protein